MPPSVGDKPARRGRPPKGGRGHLVGVRLQPDKLAALDSWIAQQPGKPTRPEAIRMIVGEKLQWPEPPEATTKWGGWRGAKARP